MRRSIKKHVLCGVRWIVRIITLLIGLVFAGFCAAVIGLPALGYDMSDPALELSVLDMVKGTLMGLALMVSIVIFVVGIFWSWDETC